MLNPELYQKTVNTLVQAYFTDQLEHGTCTACAVGNICKSVAKPLGLHGHEWGAVFMTLSKKQYQFFDAPAPDTIFQSEWYKGKSLIKATGYTETELAQIEYAFETAPYGENDEDWMFNGLMAVVDVLDIIHKNPDTALTSETKKMFSKVHAAQVGDATTAEQRTEP